MIPKKHKEIVNIVSEEMDVSSELIDDLTSFYYKSMRRKLSNVEDLKFRLPGLGYFLIRNTGVNKAIKKFESMKNGMGDATFNNYHNRKIIESRLEKLYEINEKIKQFMETRKQFKENKYGKQIENNLEKPETDI
jgi:hypothetical protein